MLNYKRQIEDSVSLIFKSGITEVVMKERYKVLVVDDHPINIKVAQQFLNRLGYSDITIAENGKNALKFINDDFSLILLDIELPDINGFDVCKYIRASLMQQIPIIAVTANMLDDKFIEKCNLVGIDDVINKPYKIDLLELKINEWLEKYKL